MINFKKIFILIRFICYLILFFISILSKSIAFEVNSYFIGHAYGYHGNKEVPDGSLKNFLNKRDVKLIIFGGDLTEDSEDFKYFDEYFKNKEITYLAVEGNHDKDLFSKIPFWLNKTISDKKIFNLHISHDMKFDFKILKEKNDTYIVQHYLWFLRLLTDYPKSFSKKSLKEKIFSKIKSYFSLQAPLANSMYGSEILEKDQIEKINFGKNNIYLAGDCGAFQGRFTYSKTVYEGNTFICSGIGSNWANNVVDLNTLEPIFFDINGETVSHSCKTKKGSLENIIEFCLPNHINAKKLWKLL